MAITKEEIYLSLLNRIESGEFKAGDKMPTERELATELQTPQWRVHLAVDMLDENGFVERRRASGTFVRSNISIKNVRRKKNKTSDRVIISVSKSFYYQAENYYDIIGDLERELEDGKCQVEYSEFPQTGNELKTFLGDFADNAKALIIFPENKEWELMHDHRDILSDYLGNIFYFNRGKGVDQLTFNSISFNFYASGMAASRWITRKDIKNIAYFSCDMNIYWEKERYAGFCSVLEKKLLNHALFTNMPVEKLYTSLAEYIKGCDLIPAIVCKNDLAASQVLYQMRAEGIEINKDFILIGFDNHPKYRMEKIVSIGWPLDKLGGIIADCVLKIDGDQYHEYRLNKCSIMPQVFDRSDFQFTEG